MKLQAITGTWKGTNTDKIFKELGKESLHNRLFCWRSTMQYKIIYNLSTINNHPHVILKYPYQFHRIGIYLFIFNLNSFYPIAIDSWNEIDSSLKNSTSLSLLKSFMLRKVSPKINSMFEIFDQSSCKWLYISKF